MTNNNNNNLKLTKEDAKIQLREAQIEYMQREKDILLASYTFPTKKSTDGYYHIAVKDSTKKSGRKNLAAKTLDDLKNKVYQHERGELGLAKKTFKNIFYFVEEDKLSLVKSPEKKLSVQNTVTRDYSEYKRFFSGSAFENMYIEDITKHDIDNVIQLNLKKYNLRDKGYSSLKAILRNVFAKATYMGYITENPYLFVDFSRYKNMIVDDIKIEERVHSSDTLSQIMNYLKEYQEKKPKYIPAYALEFQILVGLRRGEVPPIMWSDIDNEKIHIWREQLTVKKCNNVPEHFVIVSHTKTGEDRYFPIYNELNEFLTRLKSIHDIYYPDSQYLFPADNENGVITNNTVYNFYRRMCKKLNIAISKDFVKGTHSFRRNVITDIINASGGNAVLASKLLGNSPEVALKYYFSQIDFLTALECLNQRTL